MGNIQAAINLAKEVDELSKDSKELIQKIDKAKVVINQFEEKAKEIENNVVGAVKEKFPHVPLPI